jgi:hypothetical protein
VTSLNLKRVFVTLAGSLLLVPAVLHLVVIARVFYARLAYPFDIEWMESGELYIAYRVLHGMPIYAAPQDFVPYPYPPGHFVTLAGLGRLVGLDYATGRGLSVFCLALVIVVQAIELLRQPTSKPTGVAFSLINAAGIVSAYAIVGGSLDLARMDTMSVALVTVAAVLVAERQSPVRVIGAALLLACAVFTKQINVFYVVWLVAFVAWRNWRRGLLMATTTLVLCIVGLVAWQAWSHGWFWKWLMNTQNHPINYDALPAGIGLIIAAVPPILLVPGFVMVLADRGKLNPRIWLWVGMLVMTLPASLLPLIKINGWVNSICPTLCLGWFVTLLLVLEYTQATASRPKRAAIVWTTLVVGAVLLQARQYDPHAFMPTPERRMAAAELHDTIRRLDGDVLVPAHAFVAARDGKGAEQIILQAHFDTNATPLHWDVCTALNASGARWIILTGKREEAYLPDCLTAYAIERDLDIPIETMVYDVARKKTLLRRRDVTP